MQELIRSTQPNKFDVIEYIAILAEKTSWTLSNFVVELSAVMSDGSKAVIQFIYKNI